MLAEQITEQITASESLRLSRLGETIIAFIKENGLSDEQRVLASRNPSAFQCMILGEMALKGWLQPAEHISG